MTKLSLLKRLDELETALAPAIIVYEAGGDISEEERQRFLDEAVGEISPKTLVVCMTREPGRPPRLIQVGPARSWTAPRTRRRDGLGIALMLR